MSPAARYLAPILTVVLAAPAWAQQSEESEASKQILDFAHHFERVANDRHAQAIDRVFDVHALSERALDGLPAGQRHALASHIVPSQWMLDGMKGGGHLRLLELRETDGVPHALFRLVGDRGLNYLDAIIVVQASGRVAILDAYVYAEGEMLSQILRHAALEYLDRGSARPSHVETTADAAAEASRYRERLEGDAIADLVALNEAMVREQWDDGLAIVTRLEALVGEDAYLDTLRAYFLCERGSYDRSLEAADQAIERDPLLEEARLVRLRVALSQRDFDAVARCLVVLERGFDWELGTLRSSPAFAEFVRSPAHTRWMLSRQTAHAEQGGWGR